MKSFTPLTLTALALALAVAHTSRAQDVKMQAVAPTLGAAAGFAAFAGSTVTNVAAVGTIVTGDVGTSPGTAITGFGAGEGVVTGTIHSADGAAGAAQSAFSAAFFNAIGQVCDTNLTGQDLGSQAPLAPGVYCFNTSAQLTGTLTLDGPAGSVWIFQTGSTLVTASNARVVFTGGASACSAFWAVGSSATIGTGTTFGGNILADQSVTLNTNATNSGALFGRIAAVSLDNNRVTAVGNCAVAPPPTPTPTPTATPTPTPTPTPGGSPTPTPTPGGSPTPTPIPPVPTMPEGAALGLLAILLIGGAFAVGRP